MTVGMKNIYRFVRLGLSVLAISVVVAQSGPEDLRLTVGKSIVIDYPDDISRISTSNADIVDASPVTAREILIHGKSFGTVTLVVWSKSGQRNFYNLTVEQNLEPLRKLLRDTFPQEDIHVQSSRDSLSLTGHISGKDAAERAVALATPFGKTVVNNLQVAAAPVEKQILLRVKFVELDRSKETQLAVNLLSTGAGNTIARTTTGQFPAPSASTLTGTIGGAAQGTSTSFNLSDALNLFAFNPRLNLGVLIKALQSKAVLQILAEPNLVTTSGKEASFVVGGEFPVPVLQGGANSGAVTVQFREYGVRLKFTPVVTESKTIRMHVTPEVSSLDYANAVTLNGFTIPALSTRKIDSDIELSEGQSFVIGGLLDNRVTESMAKVPGLGDIPLLGYLFRSKDISKSNTELIVLVTPEITMPLNPSDPKPTVTMPHEFMTTYTTVPEDQTKSAKGKK